MIIYQRLFYSLPISQICENSPAKVLYSFISVKIFDAQSCLMGFGIRLPKFSFEKLINFELFSQTYIEIKELDYLLKNQQYLLTTYKKSLLYEKKI